MAWLLEKLPAPLFNWTGEMPWTAINSLFDPFYLKACSGTGRATLSRLCLTRRSTCTSSMRSMHRPRSA